MVSEAIFFGTPLGFSLVEENGLMGQKPLQKNEQNDRFPEYDCWTRMRD